MIPKTSKRRTSKFVLLSNTALAWGLAFYGVSTGQATAVVASSLALIASIYGAYVGIGHMDYRKALSSIFPPIGFGDADMASQELEGGGAGTGPIGFVPSRD
ncbi:holin class II [Rhizobium phage Pasto]|uniref:Holin class II n=1 Tax=Rhizobium phage Pasto TaxID=2767575 RepID=A0A7S6R6Y0_9CAUD|nr:holin class II [Rhizobium phage Pasto]